MNFQDLQKILTDKEYLDRAFSKARNRVEKAKQKKIVKDRLGKSREIESIRICVVKDTLHDSLFQILKAFPNIDELPIFYQELIKCNYEIGDIKKSLSSLNWAIKNISKFYSEYNGKILRCKHHQKINFYRKEFYGRTSSVMKQVKKFLLFLEDVRKTMRQYPTVKTSLYSVALFGFPNVGKTTLFFKLTGSKPEISNYAFTTKNLNMGYAKFKIGDKEKKIQFIDTPGSMDRFEKLNPIEKQAVLALEHIADIVVYIFDLTEGSFPLDDQLKLYKRLKSMKKDTVVYLAKNDIYDKKAKELEKEFLKKYKALTTVEEVRKVVIKNYKEPEPEPVVEDNVGDNVDDTLDDNLVDDDIDIDDEL